MEKTGNSGISGAMVNYDDVPIAQIEVDGIDYRADTGLGSAVAISKRAAGTWSWVLAAEARWDGRRLRANGLEHAVLSVLGEALASEMSHRAEWNH